MTAQKTVYLGMSGGVDSSASACLLLEQGYNVVGIYMKNWSTSLPGMHCPWAEDLADAKRVAVKLGIKFEVWDFEKDYKAKVVDYMLAEFAKGRTPNPDVICNQEIKFILFFEEALKRGADYIATGHYARQVNGELLRAKDENKDQTYFLYRMPRAALAKTIFPVGNMLKPDVKKYAAEHDLANAYKKESMGVCFVGEVGMKDFLSQYIETTPGQIIEDETGTVLGSHDGAIFYTLGQRHGLYIGGGLPYYVVGKDLDKNAIYVSKNLNHPNLWTDKLELEDVLTTGGSTMLFGAHCRFGRSETYIPDGDQGSPSGMTSKTDKSCQKSMSSQDPLLVRLRHRAPLLPAALRGSTLTFSTPIKRPAPGQSAVFYSGETCLGGGIVK